jgi:hypothetical protein
LLHFWTVLDEWRVCGQLRAARNSLSPTPSQTSDVGSIPIARSLLTQLALSRESYEPEEGVNRGQPNVPVAIIYKQAGSTARDVHAP